MNPRQALNVWTLAHAPAYLGSDHQLLTRQLRLFEPVADDGFGDAARVARRPARVDIGSIQKVDPGLYRCVEDIERSLLIGSPTKLHRPQAQLGDFNSCTS